MPRRSILSATERESLLALPDAKDELIRHYTFNETDLSFVIAPPSAPGRTSQAQGRQQIDVAGMAAPVARQAELSAYA